ncbi:hypothetical protein GCM10011416_18980 [Polaribacter pacificus]|uniref:HTH luxR-type domain-containing protein n=1 Tax=Polaribacter pacificus TaxID=1775173 RepID=A0A917I0C4_9FLAO|nr:hypothetical protein [Polaribacter pacificus]GGH00577.1 hypothetical protein GCM10011416_18980 [Polaribacter pacificus]
MKKRLTILTFLILFFSFLPLVAQEKIIKNGDEWKYYDQGNLSKNWFLKTKSTSWKKGITPIGYGDNKVSTIINFGQAEDNKDITKYFEKEIILTDAKEFLGYEFKLQRDDGAVIYINGVELFRDNMPNTTIDASTLALTFVDIENEDIFHNTFFENTIFKNGKNTIRVEIHQSSKSSSDCIFSLELIGYKDQLVYKEIIAHKELMKVDLEDQINFLNSKFDIEKVTSYNQLLNDSNDKLKYIIFVLLILLLIVVFSAFLYISYLKGLERRLLRKNNDLSDQLLTKEKEMVKITTNLLHNKQHFKEIRADIKSIQTNETKLVKSIVQNIDSVLESDKEWESFQVHFNAVNDNFYDKLIKLHPDLTNTELRFCAFVKLHMQTKEIARILLIDPRSVQTARYRIKKKMKLGEDVDLRDYLLDL